MPAAPDDDLIDMVAVVRGQAKEIREWTRDTAILAGVLAIELVSRPAVGWVLVGHVLTALGVAWICAIALWRLFELRRV